MKPMQEIRKAIHELNGKEFLATDLKHIPAYCRNLNNLLNAGELQEAGRTGCKIIYSASEFLRPWTYERYPVNPERIARKKIQKAQVVKVVKPKNKPLEGWREVCPWMFQAPLFKQIGKTVHKTDY